MTNNAGKNHFLLSLLAVMATLASAEARPAAQPHVPKLVVNILIDQLRSDYVEAFMPLYGEGGFRRLFEEGCVYTRGEYPMAQPDRASAAATVAAGTTPYNHGVTGRQWFDRATLRPVQSVDDRRYADTEGVTASAPTSLAVSTLSDELKMATGGRALVYSIAPYRDMAVLAAGHAGDAAVWIDNRTGNWCTSSYYGTKPAWVTSRNEYGAIGKLLKAVKWLPYSQASESFSYFQQSGAPTSFDPKFRGEGQFRSFKTSALVNEDVEALAEGCLSATALGQDEATDYLAVAFYAGTFEHRSVNEVGAELQDTYVRLDRAIAQLIAAVERKVGTNRALFVVTSTGYSDASAAGMEQYRVPCGTFDMGKASLSAMSRSDYFYAGSVLYALKDYRQAIENFSKMTDRTDSIGQIANYNLGYCYIQTGDKVSAMGAFKDASSAGADPDIREDAFFNYAKLSFDLNADSSVFQEYLREYSFPFS